MSGQSEIEELRRIRAQQREEAEAARLAEIEKQKERDKRAAFKAKAASFEQKGPSAEDVKASVQKEAASRKFNRLLSKQLSQDTSKSPVSTEINLRNQMSNKTPYGHDPSLTSTNSNKKSDWEYVDQGSAGPSYYWNRVTNETTYEIPYELKSQQQDMPPPPPPPPPPRRHLPGMEPVEQAPPVEPSVVEAPPVDQEDDPSDWELVTSQPGGEYYWNTKTNECTYEMPACIVRLLHSVEEEQSEPCVEGGEAETPRPKYEIRWDESYQASYYFNHETGESSWDQPADYVA